MSGGFEQADQNDAVTPLGWWSISGEDFLAALRRVADGESPDMVYAEAYANSAIERSE